MPALNFQQRFAPAVENGTKRQTIRAYRKDGRDPEVGQTLYLYTGMRRSECRKLGEAECAMAAPVEISRARLKVALPPIGLEPLSFTMDEFAFDDGFDDWKRLCAWFEKVHGLPFRGLLIRWGQLEML